MSASTSFDHGAKSSIGTTAVQIASDIPAGLSILLRADPDNTARIFIGKSDVTAGTTDATDGMPLDAGESLEIETDNVNDAYAIAASGSQKIYFLIV